MCVSVFRQTRHKLWKSFLNVPWLEAHDTNDNKKNIIIIIAVVIVAFFSQLLMLFKLPTVNENE